MDLQFVLFFYLFLSGNLLTSFPVVAYSVEFIAKLSMVASFEEFRKLPALLVWLRLERLQGDYGTHYPSFRNGKE